MQKKIILPMLAAIVGLVLAIGNFAFTKAHHTSSHLTTTFHYIGSLNDPAEERVRTNYAVGSESCDGLPSTVCTIVATEGTDGYPDFPSGENPYDNPTVFSVTYKSM